MHTEYLQSLRYKLQKRIRRQKTVGYESYIFLLRQLLQFLDAESPFVAIQAELMQQFPQVESVINVSRAGLLSSLGMILQVENEDLYHLGNVYALFKGSGCQNPLIIGHQRSIDSIRPASHVAIAHTAIR